MGRKKLPPEEKKARHEESVRKYYEKNKDKILARQKEAYHANIELSRAWQRSYRQANRERARAHGRAYYAAHREEILAKQREQRMKKKAQQASE